MDEDNKLELVIGSRNETQPEPSSELSNALMPIAQRVEGDIVKLCEALGDNSQTAFPMDAVDGLKPDPIPVFTVRRKDANGQPAETLSVRMVDGKTVEVMDNDGIVATFRRDVINPAAPKWTPIQQNESGSIGNNQSLEDLIHDRLTTLVNQTAFREDPPTCQRVFETYLRVYPVQSVFQINYRHSDNYAKLSQRKIPSSEQ